jgi:hypothetical protein
MPDRQSASAACDKELPPRSVGLLADGGNLAERHQDPDARRRQGLHPQRHGPLT